jgi:hypothetical protein
MRTLVRPYPSNLGECLQSITSPTFALFESPFRELLV